MSVMSIILLRNDVSEAANFFSEGRIDAHASGATDGGSFFTFATCALATAADVDAMAALNVVF